jgi:hypothetical protein
MFVPILLTLLGIVAACVLYVALKPGAFRIERTAVIPAAKPAVFDEIHTLARWEAWSPWAQLDPNMEQSYSGPAAGVGASQSWKGNKQVGEGRLTITDSQPCDYIRMTLEFVQPFQVTNQTEFIFESVADGTQVTWRMTGVNGFLGKVFDLLMNMDKMCGNDFEKGFANLRKVLEAKRAAA